MHPARSFLVAATLLGALPFASASLAADYIVLRDTSGAVAADPPNVAKMRKDLRDGYAAAGLPEPEVFSVWTNFSMTGNDFNTYIDPRYNDVDGIGLDVDPAARLQAILWHNNVLALQKRANLHKAPLDGYGRYLFLLEFSHLWGPAAAAPMPVGNGLIGFTFHWSFFLDAPGPAGGNTWVDQGDGSFRLTPGDPKTLGFSMLDLYLMGLAEPAEVMPFGLLTDPVVPATPTDPFWGGQHSARSFPFFDTAAAPFVVSATRTELTVDDIILANGPRSPAAFTKTSWDVGFVLMVGAEDTDEEIATAKLAFEPILAESIAGFSEATLGRGTLVPVPVPDPPGEGGAGGASPTSSATMGAGGSDGDGGEADSDSCSCQTPGSGSNNTPAGLSLAALAALLWAARRKHPPMPHAEQVHRDGDTRVNGHSTDDGPTA